MALVTKTKTWADNESVTYSDINGNFDTLYGVVNGNVDNANINASAGIVESKISFNTASGHNHDGTNSRAIPKGYVVAVVGSLVTGTSLTPVVIAVASQTITKAYAYVKTAPVGASILIDINKNGTSLWATNQANRLAIASGANSGTQTSFDTTTLADGDILTFDIDQIGSSTAGADITIVLK
jgi:hypothetical protein